MGGLIFTAGLLCGAVGTLAGLILLWGYAVKWAEEEAMRERAGY